MQEVHNKPLHRRLKRKIGRINLLLGKSIYRYLPANHEKKIIIVGGVQRSGTNMLMNVLEQPLYTSVYHERDNRLYKDYQIASKEKLYETIKKENCTVVFKALCELQYIENYLSDFQEAKCIWVFRHYENVIDSQMRHGWHKAPLFIKYIVEGNIELTYWRATGVKEEILNKVRDLAGNNGMLDTQSAIALFWYYRNLILYHSDMHINEKTVVVSYESMTKNPEIVFPKIFGFIPMRYKKKYIRNVGRKSSSIPGISIKNNIRDACEELLEKMKKDEADFLRF